MFFSNNTMAFDKRQTNIAKGIAVLFMLYHHLFFDTPEKYKYNTINKPSCARPLKVLFIFIRHLSGIIDCIIRVPKPGIIIFDIRINIPTSLA